MKDALRFLGYIGIIIIIIFFFWKESPSTTLFLYIDKKKFFLTIKYFMLCCACRRNKVNGQLRQDNADNLHLTTSTLSFARQAFYPHNYRGEYERFLDTKAVCV